MDSEDVVSVSEVGRRQRALEEAARRHYPGDPSECTLYMDVPPRQPLFACRTCAPANALCYSCGIRCHAGHELVELYSKRAFRCDCGTSRIPASRCTLRPTTDDAGANGHLNYGHNFAGRFCVCGESVEDSSYGEGAMFQCLLGTRCGEDWFHARCIAGINRSEEAARQARAAENGGLLASETESEPEQDSAPEHAQPAGSAREHASAGEPIGEPIGEPVGEPIGEPRGRARPHEEPRSADASADASVSDASMDDDDEESGDELDAVFPELPAASGAVICAQCAADVPALAASDAVVLAKVNGYLFLREDFGERVRADPELAQLLREYPFLDGTEETYEPKPDEDATSLLEAGTKALASLPHEAVVDGLARFNELQTSLVAYLRSIGSDGHAITREDVERFFSRSQ